MLDKKLKGQVKLAIWQLLIAIIAIIGYFLMGSGLSDYHDVHGAGADLVIDDMGHTSKMKILIGALLAIFLGITSFILWIIGIVKAVAIQNITHDSSVLVVFSILTLFIAHLITAVVQKNKFLGTKTDGPSSNHGGGSYEQDLKKLLVDGILTPDEYQRKLKEYNEKNI